MISKAREKAPAIVLIVAILTVLVRLVRALRGVLPFDDAYMFARYADNMISHGTFGWNVGEKTYGCTSIAYTFVVTAAKMMNINDTLSTSSLLILLSFGFGCIALFILFKMVKDIGSEGSIIDQDLTMLVMAGIAISTIFFFNIFNGMDASMSLFSNTMLIYAVFLFSKKQSTALMGLAAFSAYFTFLVRPDNGIYSLFFPFLFLLHTKVPLRKAAGFFLVLGCFFALDLFIKNAYFGDPLPLSFYAKSSGFYEGFVSRYKWNPIEYTTDFFLYFGLLLLFAVGFINKARAKTLCVFLIPMLMTFAYYLTVVQVMGFNSRYYMPSIPFIIFGSAYALRDVTTASLKSLNLKHIYYAFLVFIFMFSSTPFVKRYLISMDTQVKRASGIKQVSTEGGFTCGKYPWFTAINKFDRTLKTFPFVKKIMITEYGLISSENLGVHIIDPIALHNKELALNGWNDDFITVERPEMVWIHNEYIWLNKRVKRLMQESGEYFHIPSALNFGVSIRKDSALLEPGNFERLLDIVGCEPVEQIAR